MKRLHVFSTTLTAGILLFLCLCLTASAEVRIENVRYADNGDFYRVVLDLSNLPSTKERWVIRNNGQERIVDLVNTSISKNCAREIAIPNNDHRLTKINLKPYGVSAETSRVIFTLTSSKVKHQAYTLTDPSRLVVDFYGEEPEEHYTERNFRVIIIDPGHGGWDSGATYRDFPLKEKDIVLDISKRLAGYFQKSDNFKVHLTRDSDVLPFLGRGTPLPRSHRERVEQRRKSLDGRVAFANQEFQYSGQTYSADAFISIHVNYGRRRGANGFEAWIPGEDISNEEEGKALLAMENGEDLLGVVHLEGEAKNDIAKPLMNMIRARMDELNMTLARHIDNEMQRVNRPSYFSRGVKKGPFRVLRNLRVPSVLLEIGFISNATDRNLLKESWFRQRVACAIYTAVNNYFAEVDGLTPQPVAVPEIPERREEVYVVRRGDNLSRIAARKGVPLSAIMRRNGLTQKSARRIQPGQEIIIPL